ncbi:MAG: hypothetical protein ACRDXX_18420 [Stackebrandtia sp.]
MSALSDQMEALVVRTRSSDGNIQGRLHHGGRVEFGFRSQEDYERYDADGLARQLGALLRAMHQDRASALRAVRAEAGRTPTEANRPHWDAGRRRYDAEVAQVAAKGVSRHRLVAVRAVGMRDHEVSVRPGALDQLDAAGFAAEFQSAYRAFRTDHRSRLNLLKRKHFPR